MSDIVGVITKVEDDSYDGKAFKKVTLGTGDVLKVKYGRDGYLKAKWPELDVGRAMKFWMGEFGSEKRPFVKDFAPVELSEQEMSHETAPEGNPPPPLPNPQEIGMWFKELGNRIGDGSITRDFPNSSVKIKSQYYKKMSEVTGIDFKKKEE